MNVGYKQIYCPSCGYRVARECPVTYTTQYNTCELNPKMSFEEYSLNYYKNELELKKQKINELQHRIELLLSEKDEFNFRLDKSRNYIREAERDWEREFKLTQKKFEQKEKEMQEIIDNLTNELKSKDVKKYEDTQLYKVSTLQRENENLRMINKNYLDVIETVLPFINKLNQDIFIEKKNNLPKFDLIDIIDNHNRFEKDLTKLKTAIVNKLLVDSHNDRNVNRNLARKQTSDKDIYNYELKTNDGIEQIHKKDNQRASRPNSRITRCDDKKSTTNSTQSKFTKSPISHKINHSVDRSKKSSSNVDDQLRCHNVDGKYYHHNSTHDKIRLNRSLSKSRTRDISPVIKSKCFARMSK